MGERAKRAGILTRETFELREEETFQLKRFWGLEQEEGVEPFSPFPGHTTHLHIFEGWHRHGGPR